MIKIGLIEPNKEQPRKDFNEEQLKELAESIKNYGILQPLLVQKKGSFYELIAGERRWRGSKAGRDQGSACCLKRIQQAAGNGNCPY